MRRGLNQLARRGAALRSHTQPVGRRCLGTYRGRGRPNRNLAVPFDQVAGGSSSSSRALAIPFAVASKELVRDKFRGWVSQQQSTVFDSSAIELAGTKPVYLPFFAFEGDVDATFTGKLGYTTTTHSTVNGRSVSRTRTDWYFKTGMRVGPKHVTPSPLPTAQMPHGDPLCGVVAMLQYAGFAFRREYVHKALHGGRLSLSIAQPLHPGMMPPGCGVHEFEAKPSFCFDKTLSTFDGIARSMAESRLHDPNLNETFASDGCAAACKR